MTRINNINVDLEALRAIAHACDPAKCKEGATCCACYEVTLSDTELEAVVGMHLEAARFAPAVRSGDFFEELEDGESTLETDDEGCCLFAFQNPGGATLCSLHAAALARELDPAAVKPRSCTLWPLALSESGPLLLGVQEDAFSFPCNRRRTPDAQGLDPGIAAIVVSVFGPEFLAKALEALQRQG